MQTLRTMILWLLAMLPATASAQTVLLDFYADWCGPCRSMIATVDAVAGEGYRVQRVDVDRERELAAKFGVDAIPCFVVLERGKEIDRIVGAATKERLTLKLHREKRQPAKPVVRAAESERRPHPAWRYEKPVGYRAAVVRIYCQDDVRTRSIGSGTLVRWGAKKIVVLTARHVIQDAKKITVELFNKKAYKARVLKVDAIWDCAVLELIGKPAGVEPAELELGDAAMQREGNRLESCGYGPDGRLACNTGLFLGYKRSTQTPNGPDDWFEISGHARRGDSGGGVFNERGRLVGVLWGGNGEVVVGVQAGRLHVLLDAATGAAAEQRSRLLFAPDPAAMIDPEEFTLLQCQCRPTPAKKPTPDLADLPQYPDRGYPPPGPIFDDPDEATAEKQRAKPILPWRGGAQARDADLDARTQNLLQAIEAERQARLASQQPPRIAAPPTTEPPKPEPKEDAPSPLLATIIVAAALLAGGAFCLRTRKNPT